VAATMAGLHMRTWFNTLPHRPHAEAASLQDRQKTKRRVRVPVRIRNSTRSPN